MQPDKRIAGDDRTLSRVCYFDGVRFERLRAPLLRCQAVQKLTVNNRTITLQVLSPMETRLVYTDGYTGETRTECIGHPRTARHRYLATLSEATRMFAIVTSEFRHLATYPTRELAKSDLPRFQAILPGERVQILQFRVLQRWT